MKKKRFIAFQEITMSKLVAIIFIFPWLVILAMQTVHLWFEVGNDLSSVLESSGTVVAIVASGYFARSGYDMYTGYKYGNYGSSSPYGNEIRDYESGFPL